MSEAPEGPSVVRWRRFGHDRLYVTAAAGTKVGYLDLRTGTAHPEAEEHAAALEAAVERWRAEQDTRPVTVVAEPVPTVEPAAPVEEAASPLAAARPWIDLAGNRAGAEAREQALARQARAPIRTLLARALDVRTDERAWRIGAAGEEKVASQLARAARKDPRWRFLHAIPVGNRGSDIDHLIIGPGGVFTVNAKHRPGAKIWVGGDTFMVNGTRQPYIRNSRHEAARASKLLTAATGFPVRVEGLVVTVNADDVTIKSVPADVHVVPSMQVARWLLRHGDILSAGMLDDIFGVARRSTTWRP